MSWKTQTIILVFVAFLSLFLGTKIDKETVVYDSIVQIDTVKVVPEEFLVAFNDLQAQTENLSFQASKVKRLEYALKIAKEREYLDSKKLFDLQKQIDSIKVLADTLEFLQSSHFDTSLVVKDIKYGDINVWYYHPVEKFSLDFFPCSLPEIHVVKYIEKPESWKDNKLLYVILGASGQIVFSKMLDKYLD